MTDPYVILGVSPSATDDEIREAYRKMSLKFHPDRHSQSTLSDLAEEKMKEINAAFDRIMDMRRGGGEQKYSYTSSQYYSGDNSVFSEIRSQIKQGNLTDAENILDQPTTQRNAEWSFLKGSVCYARGWLNEAFENFSNAVRLDPQNAEYNAALNSMINARQGNMNGNPNPYRGRDTVCGCSACDLCQGLVCADCCCECSGGDLISCC
ncbi:MAG TPA: DnaJ domain-containing protein [Oscillospiraceae bacterium]|nr:DnaJ domain-containing protein [Oscillospiraceae bacterium]